MSAGPGQRSLDFNPIEATPEEQERLRRLAFQWTLEDEAEDFKPLPGETLQEFFAAREAHLRTIEAFGPTFPREPCDAWKMLHGQGGPPRPRPPRQLPLPFDKPSP